MTTRPKRIHNREVSILCGWQLGGDVGASMARDAWTLLNIRHYLSYLWHIGGEKDTAVEKSNLKIAIFIGVLRVIVVV